jgi:hypothetical protein
MKKILSIVAIAAIMASCNDSKKEETTTTTTDSIVSDATNTNAMATDTTTKMPADTTHMMDTTHKMETPKP